MHLQLRQADQVDVQAWARLTLAMSLLLGVARQATRCLAAVHGRNQAAARSCLVHVDTPAVDPESHAEAVRRPGCQGELLLGNWVQAHQIRLEAVAGLRHQAPSQMDIQEAVARLDLHEVGMAQKDKLQQAHSAVMLLGCPAQNRSCRGAFAAGRACGGAGGCGSGTLLDPPGGVDAFASFCAAVLIVNGHQNSLKPMIQRASHSVSEMPSDWPLSSGSVKQPLAELETSEASRAISTTTSRETATSSLTHPASPARQPRRPPRHCWAWTMAGRSAAGS